MTFTEANPERVNRIQLQNNMIRHPFDEGIGSLAVAILTPFADAIFENNRIDGAISFYGNRAVDINEGHASSVATYMRVSGRQLPLTQSVLQLRNNQVTRVAATEFFLQMAAIGDAGPDPNLPVYRNAFVTDNLFKGLENTFIAGHVALTTNVFELFGTAVGVVAGSSATYIGNKGFSPNATLWNLAVESEQVANLLLTIVDF